MVVAGYTCSDGSAGPHTGASLEDNPCARLVMFGRWRGFDDTGIHFSGRRPSGRILFGGGGCVGQNWIVFGGSNGARTLGDTYVLRSDERKWEHLDALGDNPTCFGSYPAARCGHACAGVGNKVIVHGGVSTGGQLLNSCSILNVETATWETLETKSKGAPPPVALHTAIAPDSTSVVFFGGRINSKFAQTAHRVDLRSGEWFGVPSIPDTGEPMAGHKFLSAGHAQKLLPAVVKVRDHRMWVIGGQAASSDIDALEVWEMDERVPRWRHVPTTGEKPCHRWGHTVSLSDGMIVLFGGWDANGKGLGDLFILDVELCQWSCLCPRASAACPRGGHGAAFVKGSSSNKALFILGGAWSSPRGFVTSGLHKSGCCGGISKHPLPHPPDEALIESTEQCLNNASAGSFGRVGDMCNEPLGDVCFVAEIGISKIEEDGGNTRPLHKLGDDDLTSQGAWGQGPPPNLKSANVMYPKDTQPTWWHDHPC